MRLRMQIHKAVRFLSTLLILFNTGLYADEQLSFKLEKEHKKIVQKFPQLSHISIEGFRQLKSSDIVLFDVREQQEFDVSHIEGAIQIDPIMDLDDFVKRYGQQLEKQHIVFYCSVGYRSSEFLAKVLDVMPSEAEVEYLNLRGGIFHWHNLDQPLQNANGATNAIHPYNIFWGRYVEKKESIKRKK